jgi:hypothetical protein
MQQPPQGPPGGWPPGGWQSPPEQPPQGQWPPAQPGQPGQPPQYGQWQAPAPLPQQSPPSGALRILYGVVALLVTAGGVYMRVRGHREGDSCKGRVGEKKGPNTLLACDGGKFVSYSCPGPQGVHEQDSKVFCDYSTAKAGDACFVAASADGVESACDGTTAMVNCDHGKIVREKCLGPKGCTSDANRVHCDSSFGDENDRCTGQGAACRVDKKAELGCKDGKMQLSSLCRGAKGCTVEADKVFCDNSIAKAGDQCPDEGDGACSDDGKAILLCTGGKFVPKHTCPGKPCAVEGDKVRCPGK